jgi:hypothetical protein
MLRHRYCVLSLLGSAVWPMFVTLLFASGCANRKDIRFLHMTVGSIRSNSNYQSCSTIRKMESGDELIGSWETMVDGSGRWIVSFVPGSELVIQPIDPYRQSISKNLPLPFLAFRLVYKYSRHGAAISCAYHAGSPFDRQFLMENVSLSGDRLQFRIRTRVFVFRRVADAMLISCESLRKAIRLFNAKQYTRALEVFITADRYRPSSSSLLGIGLCHYAQGDVANAFRVLNSLLYYYPNMRAFNAIKAFTVNISKRLKADVLLRIFTEIR